MLLCILNQFISPREIAQVMQPATRNSALISSTMLCEVSRLLEADHVPGEHGLGYYTALRVSDLLSLIEAVSLHETLYTLPAQLDSDASNLRLRNELITRGIVKELDLSEKHESLGQSILVALSKVKNLVHMDGWVENIGTPIDFEKEIRGQIAKFLQVENASESYRGLYNTFDFDVDGTWEADSLEDLGRSLILYLDSDRTGAYEHCSSILRDMYYVLAAEESTLSYWPQTTRRNLPISFQTI